MSILGLAAPTIFRALGYRRTFETEDAMLAKVAQAQAHPESHTPPRGLESTVDISLGALHGWLVYTVTPRGTFSPRRALYSHGGSWYGEISPFHWRFIAHLATTADVTFTVPIYPLAPTGTAATVIPWIADLAQRLVESVGPENVTLLGDSAGGQISLSAAMELRDRGVPAPHNTVLISPALDLAFTNPAIEATAPLDPWLAPAGIRAAANLWRGDLPFDDPRVSPLLGSFDDLAPITMFSGTRDILNADARALVDRARTGDIPLDYHEAQGMVHVYPILPMTEGKRARAVIAELLAT